MPLLGVNGRLFTWCVVCRDEVPSRHKTLRIHLNRAHGMEFIPGCPSCFYMRRRWADVKKHCERQHQLDIDRHHGDQGVAWGLTRLDDSSARPTYSNVAQSDICKYPTKEEHLTFEQLRVVGCLTYWPSYIPNCSSKSWLLLELKACVYPTFRELEEKAAVCEHGLELFPQI